jgi:acyl-CoA thioester hydrolase
MGHVNNIVYVQWMEVGRHHLLEAVGWPINVIAQQGFGPVLVETSISYRKPLLIGDRVQINIWLSKLSQASAWAEFEFFNGQGLVAQGKQRGLFVDLASNRPKRLQAEERARFLPYVIAAE